MAGTVTISENELEATISSISANDEVEAIVELLKSHGVVDGLQSSAIFTAISEAKEGGKAAENLVVAAGEPPIPEKPPALEICPRLREDVKLESLASVVKLLACEAKEDVMEAARGSFSAFVVAAGDLLAKRVIGEVKPGMTVTGKTLTKIDEAGLPPQFEPGRGVKLANEEYRAEHAGYAGTFDGRLCVVAPVWIPAEAAMAAVFCVSLADGSATPTKEDVIGMLEAGGVEHGIDGTRVDTVLDRMGSKALIPVAFATEPVEPVDGTAIFHFAHESLSGAVQDDGSIDLRERSEFPSVAAEALLGESKPPVPGTPGTTVRGDELPVREPVTVELVAGDKVRATGEGAEVQLFAEINGGANVQTVESSTQLTHTVSVREIAQVSGNVDYETGNINFEGNVEVKGSVVSGFKVEATGDVVVMESVENGAEVHCEGNLTVKQGIQGEKTHVTAGGDIRARFIQEALVEAEGELIAESYIRAADVRSQTRVAVEASGDSGGIFGGEVWALDEVVSNNVGAVGTETTLIALGAVPKMFEEVDALRKEIQQAEASMAKLLGALGLSSLAAEEVKALVERNPRRAEAIEDKVAEATGFADTIETSKESVKALAEQIRSKAATVHLDVSNTAFHKVRVRVGNAETVLTADIKGARFRLKKKDGQEEVGWDSLT